MIKFTKATLREEALKLSSYIRAGEDETKDVDDSHYSRQRMTVIGDKLSKLLAKDSFDPTATDAEIESYYVRWCGRYCVDRLLSLGDWKGILEVIASRLRFYAINNLTMSRLTIVSLRRAWFLVRASRYGE